MTAQSNLSAAPSDRLAETVSRALQGDTPKAMAAQLKMTTDELNAEDQSLRAERDSLQGVTYMQCDCQHCTRQRRMEEIALRRSQISQAIETAKNSYLAKVKSYNFEHKYRGD